MWELIIDIIQFIIVMVGGVLLLMMPIMWLISPILQRV